MTTTTAREPLPQSDDPGDARRAAVRGRLLEVAAVLLAAGLLAIALTWPLAARLGDHTLGDPRDARPTIAWLGELRDGEGGDRFAVTDADRSGPPFTAADGAAAAGRSALVYGPTWLAAEIVGEVAAYNLLILLGLALSAAAMYWLLRVVGTGWAVAAWAGLAFTVLPWHLLKAEGHPTLVHLEGLPLLVLATVLWFRRPRSWRVVLPPAATAGLWLTSVSLGVVGTIAAIVLVAVAAAVLRRRPGSRAALASAVAGLSVAAVALLFSLVLPLGPARAAESLGRHGARPWEYLLPAARNPVFGNETGAWLERHRHGAPLSETSLYVGWVTVVLAAAFLLPALVRGAGRSRERRFLALGLAGCVVAGLAFSLPSPLPGTDLPMPVRGLWDIEPAFALPSRFFALVATALVTSAALGLEGLRRSALSAFRSPRAGLLVGLALCVAVAGLSYLELATTRADVVRYPTAPAGAPRR